MEEQFIKGAFAIVGGVIIGLVAGVLTQDSKIAIQTGMLAALILTRN